MDPRPPNWLLFIAGLLHWQCATVQTLHIIDRVFLSLSPSNAVESGTNVILLCELTVSHDSTSKLTYRFKFTKNDQEIHSFTTEDQQAVGARYDLFPARAADSGSYGCHVTVNEKSKSSLERTLTVRGMQKPILHLNRTEVFESEEVVARCSAPSEKGSFIFYLHQWSGSRDTSETVKPAKSDGNSIETRLVFNHIGESHVFCDYEIPLVGRSNHSNQVKVLVKAMYINPVMNVLPSSEVYEGDIIEVVCKVVGTDMDVDVYLIKDKTVMKRASVSLSHRFKAQDGDSGELVCKAEWRSLQKETYHIITIKELISKPRLTVEPRDLFEGDRLKVICSVSIYVPDRIQNNTLYLIYKDHKEVHRGRVYNTTAQASSNGNYTCKVQASSSSSSFVKESQTLIVNVKVPVSKPTMSVVGGTLVLGKPFQLICQSERGSLPISYTLNSPKEPREIKFTTKPGEIAIFTTTVTKTSQLNDFLCQARNHHQKPPEIATGQQLLDSTIIIEPVYKVFLTSVPDVKDITERHDVTLYCSVLRGSVPVTFTWYSADTGAPLASQTSLKHKASYVISDVGTQHDGGYYCESTNAANVTKSSEVLTIAVRMAGWKKALIAVVCLLFLAALILLTIFKKHMISFRRKRSPELSVKSAGTKIERLSLTQSEVTQMANATPSMMGKSVWSEHVSGSESENENTVAAPKTAELEYAEVQTKQTDPSREFENENSVAAPKMAELEYAEVQTKQTDPSRAPVKKGTDTTYSEVRHSTQGVPEAADSQTSVEYAELNHDTEAQSGDGNHDDHTVQEEHKEEPCEENCDINNDTGGAGE